MFPQKAKSIAEIDSKTYPLGEKIEHPADEASLALVALSHTPVERRLYAAMLAAINGANQQTENHLDEDRPPVFTVRTLMDLTGIVSLSTIRRGLEGLVTKFSIEREVKANGNGTRDHISAYRVFPPEQVIARREERGMKSYAKGIDSGVGGRAFERVIQRVVENKNLSRREAQVALCCVEGLTNAEIGLRLLVSEQTVKFHLRHIFIKFGVRRRAELISRLLL
ncbi:MAG TPA: LuxR C-terminal-related transcriptional regulator [Pyrinomonadaceae bacterium]|nr:LuxR C-terminal-related transcriptional regulator [Pyrinomonadaceae bacterium]